MGIKIETSYKGLPIRASSNLHEECISMIKALALSDKANVLDVGAGEGAFSKRLMDLGYRVTAVEREVGRYQCNAPCYNVDLNLDFAQQWLNTFDLIVATEIIEHINNPRHFINNCLRTLKNNGWLVVTSPNLESWLSRLTFLRTGRFIWFSEEDYQSIGHITPIFSWQMRQICHELRADLVKVGNTNNRYMWKMIGDTPLDILKSKAFYMGMFYPLMRSKKDGEINIFLIRKSA